MEIQMMLDLHKQGLTNRQIAKKIGVHHNTIGAHLKKIGINCNGWKGVRLEIIDDEHAKCSRCCEVKSLFDWPMAREGKKHPYRLSYCQLCRKKQMYLRLNACPESFMGDRFHKVKRRALVEKTEFNLTKEFVIQLYKSQNGLCFYTGETLHLMNGKGRLPTGLSIDRVDNSKGYTVDNVVLCTSRFNTIKSNMSLEEIKKWMPTIYEKIEEWRRRGIFVFNCCQHDQEF